MPWKIMSNQSIIPPLPIVMPENSQSSPVSDNDLLDIYNEILDDLRNDRKEVDSILANFVEMVMNEGDSTSSSKEALVNLAKIKIQISQSERLKLADLMTSWNLRKDKDQRFKQHKTII